MKWILLLNFVWASLHSAAQANRNDVVIDEIMADPAPPARLNNGLPEVEFIELRNTSQKALNLSGWKLSDVSNTATITTSFILQPDSFVIISSVSGATLLSPFSRTLGVSNFPSLDNDGDLIYITSKEGRVIHSIEYHLSWYQNAVKSNGGWTLEMIDTKNTCNGASNWIASVGTLGGTPGVKNSVDAINPDIMPPALLRSYATDSNTVVLIFDEPLDSISSAGASNFYINNDIGPAFSAMVPGPIFNRVTLKLQHPLKRNTVYSITAKFIRDCAGNAIGSANNAKVGLVSLVENSNVIINEILFNPRPEGVDYVEIYNRSEKVLDLKDIYLGNLNGSGSPGSLKQLSAAPRLIFPGEYLVLTENSQTVQRQYLAKFQGAFLEMNSLPSFPDDKGNVILLGASGNLIDEVAYSEKWHFKLIDNYEGVTLERINFNNASQGALNWHSASTSSGYGTPGYQNSQFMLEQISDLSFVITPRIFSPDNDGFDDFTTITYNFPEPGYACNISLYDINGRLVKYLTRNAICGLNGYFRWDGLDEKNNKLSVGMYVMIAEVFNLKGKTKKFKAGIVLARKLK